ncbi:hypothetical protein D9757_006088 [Collybiopsis confluens]|uniref:Muskelin N-terminal domain-containing protein n=1 Tax=Collybiopsis confluens TaxID=2823264 RepID=A0A8H5HHF0_9AGAR|nr:hypothetical protein D9757_006088 [Collybiopsis confluens]
MEPSAEAHYTVVGCSSFSNHFFPENILIDDPSNSKSRWTTGVQRSENGHWIMLALEKLSILKSITFGKFHNIHPCNMKEFKVYVGLTQENMTEVLYSSLRNDPIRESFSIRHQNTAGHYFPTRFVKIEPLSVHGQSFNTSIWNVTLTGIVNEKSVKEIKRDYDQFREVRVMQHVLKHLRQRRLLTPYDSIISRLGIQLEHPLITELYESLVVIGDWDKAELLLRDISTAALFDQYLQSSQPRASWSEILDTDANGEVPCPRGGHSMCIDQERAYIYLFGGWDGSKSLDDFWRYSIKEERWTVLSPSTSFDADAPSPRSCHKSIYDSKTNSIWILGRLDDLDKPTPHSHAAPVAETVLSHRTRRTSTIVDDTPTLSSRAISGSEFYRYDCDSTKWEHVGIDLNGPRTLFDHAMVMDSETDTIYVFGGRASEQDFGYSGMYSYNVRLKKWKLLLPVDDSIPSRYGHSMILEPSKRQIYIFAGEREDKFLSDMYIYHIATNTVTEVYSNFTSSGGPEPCFTQRAVFDAFDGLIRNRSSIIESSHWLYRYQSQPGKWEKMLREEQRKKGSAHSGPLSRFAHQVVYDNNSKTIYLHGGATMIKRTEASDSSEEMPTKRLSDFWKMNLRRLSADELIRRSAYLIRQQRFKEMCSTSQPAVQTLLYLQNQVSEVVNHDNENETQLFRSLLTHLLAVSSPPLPSPSGTSTAEEDSAHFSDRSRPPAERFASESMISPANTPERAGSPIKVDRLEPNSEPGSAGSGDSVLESRVLPSSDPLKISEDPYETSLRPTAAQPVSQERFAQRTKTFEAILEFVADEVKQPSGSLLDLIDVDVGSPV